MRQFFLGPPCTYAPSAHHVQAMERISFHAFHLVRRSKKNDLFDLSLQPSTSCSHGDMMMYNRASVFFRVCQRNRCQKRLNGEGRLLTSEILQLRR